MTATAVILTPGDVLGGFRIADVIGIGGMAVVYRARQTSLDREVALKVLSPELARDETFSERFRAEGMHAARLEHPNVIPVYDAGEDQGRLYLAMRLVDGMSLAERLRASPLTAREALDILRPIASGLDAAHGIGLIHRDVKPQNILLAETGHPYLADFGVAKGVESAGLTATGGFVGTLNYAAPEQILGSSTTPATDVYGLAAVLYHCVTGAVPYPRDAQAGLMFAQVNQAPPRVPLAEAAEFNRLMERGMAKDPQARYATAGELMSAAELALGRLSDPHASARPAFSSSPGAPTWPGDPAQPPARARPRRSIRQAATGLAVALVIAAAAVVASSLGGRAAAAPRRLAQSPPLAVSYTAPWRPASRAFGAFALRPKSGAGRSGPIQLQDGLATLAAGWLARSGAVPGGPPPALVARFGHPDPARAPRGSARGVYRWILSGVRNLTVFVIPTTRGDLAVICSAPVGMSRLLAACDAMAGATRVSGVARIPVGPDGLLAGALGRIVARTEADRSALRGMYSRHSGNAVGVADRLARADRAAEASLRKLRVPPRFSPGVSQLAAALGAEAAALARLSRAIPSRDQKAYSDAAAELRKDERELSGLGGKLRAVGLLSAGLSPAVVPRLPVLVSASPVQSASTTATSTTYTTPATYPPPVTYYPPSSPQTSSSGSGTKGTGSSSTGSSGPIN